MMNKPTGDARIQGVDANVPDAPWNRVRAIASSRLERSLEMVREDVLALPYEQWREYPAKPRFPDGMVAWLADLVESGARIAIVGDSQAGKSTLQLAIHQALRVPNALVVSGPSALSDIGASVPDAQLFSLETAPAALNAEIRVASWYELLSCGHLFRLYHDAPTVCSTRGSIQLATYWLDRDRGGTITVPDPVRTAAEALYDVSQCFPFVAALATHIVLIKWQGRDAHTYHTYAILG